MSPIRGIEGAGLEAFEALGTGGCLLQREQRCTESTQVQVMLAMTVLQNREHRAPKRVDQVVINLLMELL